MWKFYNSYVSDFFLHGLVSGGLHCIMYIIMEIVIILCYEFTIQRNLLLCGKIYFYMMDHIIFIVSMWKLLYLISFHFNLRLITSQYLKIKMKYCIVSTRWNWTMYSNKSLLSCQISTAQKKYCSFCLHVISLF